MSERIHVLAQQLLAKDSVEACTVQELEELARRYPYFAPAQFLLLQKLKQDNDPAYVQQLQKAVLYYHDPLQFEYFINSGRFETDLPLDQTNEAEEETPDQEGSADFDHFETQAEYTEAVQQLPGEINVETPEPVEENLFAGTEEQEPESSLQTSESPPEEVMQMVSEPNVTETADANLGNTQEIAPVSDHPNDAVEQEMQDKIEKLLVHEEQVSNEVPKNNSLVFEPYHTVDYFASQGIKLSQAEFSSDKFGRQLKSFTEWLKTMKRLPAGEVEKQIDTSNESKVQHLAQDSVHDSSVVTEAMAEVWVKQGNIEKAIETYNKLGLQNPSKKAYFAGLIENLKRS